MPIMDSGASLLYNKDNRYLEGNWKIGTDKAKPFKDTHEKQMQLILGKLNGKKLIPYLSKQEFLEEVSSQCSEVFRVLGDVRSRAIIRYLSARFTKYLEGVMEDV